MSAQWKVWSWDARNGMWLQVDQGPKSYAQMAARYRNRAAELHEIEDACYVATPPYSHPGVLPASPSEARRADL